MRNYYKDILLGAVICSSTFLSGYDFYEKDGTVKQQPVKTGTKDAKNIADKDLALAKFMFEHPNDVRAFEIFAKYAAQGNTEAEAWIGRCFIYGVGTAVNYDKAFEYFSKAAAKNHPYGINGLGVCKQYGYGTNKDLQVAMEFYKKAADMDFPIATLNLARVYSDKRGGFFDEKLAEEYFKKAIELNAPVAKSSYASFLYDANRYAEAIPLLKQTLDNSQSILRMAMCYLNGWGTPVNIAKAVELAEENFLQYGPESWSADVCFDAGLEELMINGMTETAKRRFYYAAEQGHSTAQYWHAKALVEEKNMRGALTYMQKSADNGYPWAMLEAGKMLLEQKDYPNAIKYFMLASTNKNTQEEAVKNLSGIYHYELKTPKTGAFWDVKGATLGLDFCRNEIAKSEIYTKGDEHFAKAAALFAEGKISDNEFATKWLSDILDNDYERLRSLADQKNSDALLALGIVGCMNEKGHPNIAIGIELLEESAKLNNATACRILGNLYRNGILAEKDLKKSLSWYQKGAEFGDAESARRAALMVYYEEVFKDTKLDVLKKIFDKALELEVMSVAYEYGGIMEYVAKDPKKAEELYRLAADFDDGRAMLRLHDMLLKNNPDEAWDYLWKAVNLEDPDAELKMGDIQRFAWNQPRTAYTMYLKANLHGESCESFSRLAECYLVGYGCELNLKMFWKTANKAYKNGSATICFTLGNVYREGKICPRNLKKAKEYFTEGEKRGSEDCKKALKEL